MQLSSESMKPILTREEEAALAERIKNGPDPIGARNELVMRNERLASMLVGKWVGRRHRDFDDLFQEAMIGLMRAAELFDPSRGLRFGTYARWYLVLKVFRALGNCNVIRVPRRELRKKSSREWSMVMDDVSESEIPDNEASPLEALIEKEEIGKRALAIRDCFDELTDDEWLVIATEFGVDAPQSRVRRIPKNKALLASAMSKLRTAYVERMVAFDHE